MKRDVLSRKKEMTSIQHQIEINWPVRPLFNYLADLSNNASWQRQVVRAEWLGIKRHAPGAAFVETRRVLEQEIPVTMQMTAFQRDQKRSFVVLHDRLHQQLSFEFEPRGESTLLKLTIGFSPAGQMRRLDQAMMRSVIREGYQNLRALKNILENSP